MTYKGDFINLILKCEQKNNITPIRCVISFELINNEYPGINTILLSLYDEIQALVFMQPYDTMTIKLNSTKA